MKRQPTDGEQMAPAVVPVAQCRGVARARDYLPFVLLALLTVGFFYPVLFQGKVFLPADLLAKMQPWKSMDIPLPKYPYNPILDAIQAFYPWRRFSADSFRQGVLPLWNPYYFAGVPFLANNQSALLYPLNILFWWLPVERAFGYAASLHFFLSGVFTFLFLRHLHLSRVPSLFGACALMLSGFFVCWMQFPVFASVAVWLPLLLLLTSKALKNWPYGVWAGFVLGVQLLGGHLQISTYVMIAFLGFAIFRIFSGEPEERRASLPILVLILALGLGLGAAQFLPTLEYSRFNYPRGGTYSEVAKGAYSPLEGLLFFIPNMFGNPVDYNDSAARTFLSSTWRQELHNYFEACNYIGVTALFLAPLAILGRARKSRSLGYFFLGLGLFALLAAFPTPLNWVIYRLAPGFRQLVHVTRAVYLWGFAFTAMAALALQSLLASQLPRRTVCYYLVACVGVLVVVAILGLGLLSFRASPVPIYQQLRHYSHLQVVRFAAFSLSSLGLIYALSRKPSRCLALALLLLLLTDLFSFGRRFNPMLDPYLLKVTPPSIKICQEEPQVRFVSVGPSSLNRLAPNLPSAFGLKDIQGTDSFCPRWYWEALTRLHQDDEFGLSKGLSSPLLDVLGVKFVLAPSGFAVPGSLIPVARPEAHLYQNPRALARARWVGKALPSQSAEALQSIREGTTDVHTTVLLPPDTQLQPATPGPTTTTAADVSILSDHSNEVIVSATATAPGFVSLSDNSVPGGRAFIDGRPVPVLFANGTFRAVQMPAGKHLLRFAFLPSSFKVGFFCLLCSVMAGIGLLAFSSLAKKPCP